MTKVQDILDYMCKLSVVCDDGAPYWSSIPWAADHGFGIIRVNHATSEEPGVAAMSRQFPEVNFHHIPQGARYRLVSAH